MKNNISYPKKMIIYWVFLATIGSPTYAENLSARVTQYGIYSRGYEVVEKDSASPSEFYRRTSEIRLLQQTNNIPMKLGIKFGYCFEISGSALNEITLTEKVSHPEIKRNDGKVTKNFSTPRRIPVVNGVGGSCGGYSLDHGFELIPGDWKFELFNGKQRLLVQEFLVK